MVGQRHRQGPRVGPDQTVQLRPIAGLAPGIYLTLLYGAAVAGLLFLVLVLPGLRFNGALVTFSSSPPGATVFVADRFIGTTPVTARVTAGRHTLTVSKDQFAPHESQIEVGGRIFLSWPFPLRETQHRSLQLDDPAALARNALLDLARSPHIASIITVAAADLSASPAPLRDHGYPFLHNALLLIQDEVGLAALLTGHAQLTTGGSPPSALSLQRMTHDFALLADDYPNLPLWLAALLPAGAAQDLIDTPWYSMAVQRQAQAIGEQTPAAAPPPPAPPETIIEAAGMVFHRVGAGTYAMGHSARLANAEDPARPFEEWPHTITLDTFYLQEQEVTKEAYARFVAAVPEWAPANRAALVARGLVTEDYLADWDDDRPPAGRQRDPVVYVSAFAAEAFADWANTQLPQAAGGSRWQARLPFEPEWEYAARGGLIGQPYPRGQQPPDGHLAAPGVGLLPVGQSAPNGYGLRDLLGSVWEWTADWYSPTRYLLARDFVTDYQTDVRFLVGSRRVVRGGSFTSDPQIVKVHTRGSQPATWCTPVLGFRLVLVER